MFFLLSGTMIFEVYKFFEILIYSFSLFAAGADLGFSQGGEISKKKIFSDQPNWFSELS